MSGCIQHGLILLCRERFIILALISGVRTTYFAYAQFVPAPGLLDLPEPKTWSQVVVWLAADFGSVETKPAKVAIPSFGLLFDLAQIFLTQRRGESQSGEI
jgi:hypothetical protein